MKTEEKVIEQIKELLEEYKNEVLHIIKDGSYNYKGKLVSHSYILPKENEERNIITPNLMHNLSGVKRHSLFNHLNSSQAMCLNLFGPLVPNHLDLLNPLFNVDLKDCVRSEFEFFDELIHDGTNFDFFIETHAHDRLYFEVKYTESTIHTICGAKDPESRWSNIYSKPIGTILQNKDDISQDVFCKQYQLWRNICRVANNHCEVYFVFPTFRKKLKLEVEAATVLLKPQFQNKVHVLTVDEICKTLLDCAENKYKEHYKEFKNKYLPEKIYNED